MMNVAGGRTLYVDIPTEIGTSVTQRSYAEVMHEIAIYSYKLNYTNLIFPLEKDTFLVISSHHQWLKDVAEHIKIIAKSYDGLAEAVTMVTAIYPFIIAVQFHHERLGKDNAINRQMRTSFLHAIYK